MKKIISLCLYFVLIILTSHAQHIIILQQGKPTSIRGLSVINDKIAWVSGSKGYIATTTDGGKSWAWQQVKGFEQADFRDIEAFSAKVAIIISSGTPALILKTIDGGLTWQQKYRNADSAYFLDAMDFSNSNHGFVLGDPIKNKFLLLETINGGNTWDNYNDGPAALPGEAAFAASGTCLRIKGETFIATGGKIAEIDIAKSNKKWLNCPVPLLQGQAAKGSFSIAINKKELVVVGGDYQHDNCIDSTACYSNNKGLTWQSAITPPAGFQSCVEFISDQTFLSTGTTGSNITIDGGKTWLKIDGASFNVCCKAKRGSLVLLAGSGGKIGVLSFQ